MAWSFENIDWSATVAMLSPLWVVLGAWVGHRFARSMQVETLARQNQVHYETLLREAYAKWHSVAIALADLRDRECSTIIGANAATDGSIRDALIRSHVTLAGEEFARQAQVDERVQELAFIETDRSRFLEVRKLSTLPPPSSPECAETAVMGFGGARQEAVEAYKKQSADVKDHKDAIAVFAQKVADVFIDLQRKRCAKAPPSSSL